MPLAVFEEVDGAAEVVLDELAAPVVAVKTCQDAGVRGGVDQPVGLREGVDVAPDAEVGVAEGDARFLQAAPVPLAAGADEIVDGEELPLRAEAAEGEGEGGADEPGSSGHDDLLFVGRVQKCLT